MLVPIEFTIFDEEGKMVYGRFVDKFAISCNGRVVTCDAMSWHGLGWEANQWRQEEEINCMNTSSCLCQRFVANQIGAYRSTTCTQQISQQSSSGVLEQTNCFCLEAPNSLQKTTRPKSSVLAELPSAMICFLCGVPCGGLVL